jgi:hypothetical protein
MPKSRKKRKSPKRVLGLPDLEQAKSAVLNTLTSKSGQRTYDQLSPNSGSRFRLPEPGISGWHSPCEGSSSAGCAGWELA